MSEFYDDKIIDFQREVRELARRRSIGGSGTIPPMDGERIAKLEAIIPTLVTKEDLARELGSLRHDMVAGDATLREAIVAGDASLRLEIRELRTDLHKELNLQTWRILGVLSIVAIGAVWVSKLFQ